MSGTDLAIQLFHHRGITLRTVLIESEPWFVAADACRMLTIRDTTSAMKMVEPDEKQSLRRSDTPHLFEGMAPQVQMMTVVNESGLYSLIFQSDKSEAVKVRRWVTGVVLPAIRKTGSYSEYPAAPRQLPSKKELAQWVVEAEERAERAESRVIELTPPAAAWNNLADSAGDYGVADAAKVLSRDPNIDTGERRLFAFMSAEGWIFKRDGRWRAYQAQVDLGRLVEKVNQPFMRDGEMFAPAPTIRITPKGLGRLQQLLGGDVRGEQLALVVST